MLELSSFLRMMQLYAHNAHNLSKGSLFLQDHDFLGELYPAYEGHYDDVVERSIGLGMDPMCMQVQMQAMELLKQYPHEVKENKEYFKIILSLEKRLCSLIENMVQTSKMSEGTRQLLGSICDDSEKRQYKLGQRVK